MFANIMKVLSTVILSIEVVLILLLCNFKKKDDFLFSLIFIVSQTVVVVSLWLNP